jgi:chaperonin GroEL (HSP60 family)
VEQIINLSDLETENSPETIESSEFTLVLPLSKAEITLKLLTRGDELAIDKELKALKKISSDVESESTSRLKAMIKSVNGDSSNGKIWAFVDSLLVKDARYLREQYRTKVPDINFNVSVDCSCGTEQKVRLPIGVNFFWPDARV